MEATAVSLARSVLDGVLSGAGSAVADEVARLLGVPREVEFIRNELEMMRSFLRVASARSDAAARNDTVRTWVKQVRDLAYDVEDCLLDFALYSATASSSTLAWPCLPGPLAARHGMAERIRELKASVVELNRRNLRYHVVVDHNPAPPGAGGAEVVVQQQLLPYHDGLSSDELAFREWEIIGRSKEKAELKEMISAGDPAAMGVVSVWGMGGMGKSSLISMVRNDPELLDTSDCAAWVTVPHPLDNTDEFMRRLRKQLGLGAEAAHDDHRDLQEHLRDKRYMIVVDDLLSQEEWDQVWQKLVKLKNAKGSRIIVTTRREDVARHCAGSVGEGNGRVYQLKRLDGKESMNLLCKKVYKTTECIVPAEMEKQANCILKRCMGLPLAISTIGGLLANRPKTSMEWMKLHEYLGAELESDPGILKVIASSYDGLPYHLKSIFLYLSIFPENQEIRRTRLLRRWMAEGYITKNRNMPVAEVGERFYNELMNRSMIQPSKKNIIPGLRVVRCTIHSILLQIIMSKAIEENQLFLIEKLCNEVPQSKVRHLVVSRWNIEEKLEDINLSHIRSLTVFGDCPISLISPKMRMLRVLDLEDTINVKNKDLRNIGDLHHLRYLSLRGTHISKLPSSLKNLQYLETLDIQDTKVKQLPQGIVKLKKLRYILAGVKFTRDRQQKVAQLEMDSNKTNLLRNMSAFLCCNHSDYCKISNMDQLTVRAPKGIANLRNLHTLGAFNVGQGNGLARRLKQLTNLQSLGVTVTGLTVEGSVELCQSIGKLGRLQKLEVQARSLDFLAKMDQLAAPKHLASLKLLGNLFLLPHWITSLNDLAKVKLLGTKLEQGQVDILGNLPNVAFLGLWEKSYIGESLYFSRGKFPKLRFLDIDGLENIEMVTIEEPKLKFIEIDGLDKIQMVTIKEPEPEFLDIDRIDKIEMVRAMPELEQLWVKNCKALRDSGDGLSGVSYLVNLNELLVKHCGEKDKLIKELQCQVSLHIKRPKFLIGKIIVSTSSQPSTSATAEK